MMDDNKFDGEKSSNEEPVQELQQYIMNVERTSERRPALRFAFLVGGVAVGSYFGVGRHVKALAKDVRVINAFLTDDLESRKYQAQAIYAALERGQEFTFLPGLGVLLGDVPKK